MARLGFALCGAALLSFGCNPADFDDLEDSTWVAGEEKPWKGDTVLTAIGPSAVPGDSDFDGPEFMVVGRSDLSLTRLSYSTSGALSTDQVNLTDFLLTEEVLATTRPTDGLVLAATKRDPTLPDPGYIIVGEIEGGSEPTDPLGQIADSSVTILTSLDWEGIAASKSRLVAIDGATIEVFDTSVQPAIRVPALGTPMGAEQGSCAPAAEDLAGTELQPSVGVLSDSFFVAGSSDGLVQLSLPDVDLDMDPITGHSCNLFVLFEEAGASMSGPILVGDFFPDADDGNPDPDIVAVSPGARVVILPDWLGPGTVGNSRSIAAPAGVSERWGESIAVGDFDGDGDQDLAVGDSAEGTVHIFDLGETDPLEPSATLTSAEDKVDFGRVVTAVPFGTGEKDLLVVGSRGEVHTYFKIYPSGDADPRN